MNLSYKKTTPYDDQSSTFARRAASAPQSDLFGPIHVPVLAACGVGVNSIAMIIDCVERGERIDAALFANAGGEDVRTYSYLEIIRPWLAKRGVPLHVVQYTPKNFKNFPPYYTLEENCLTNGTLPSKAFGFGSCSIKWKVAPQNLWTEQWPPAQAIWAGGGKVIKLIGYDCSPQDQRRYAEAEGYDDPRYVYRYPLRERGWDRDACKDRITKAGLPVPPKSACFFCPVTKPHELREKTVVELRRIVLLEARAMPRLHTVQGLWRRPVKGCGGATPRPGSMTEYIRAERLLPEQEIAAIISFAPAHLTRWQQRFENDSSRPRLREWLDVFDASAGRIHLEGLPEKFGHGGAEGPDVN